jgi:hypothetical protein
MTNRIGTEAVWQRGFVPAGFLVLLFTLFLAPFVFADGSRATPQAARVSADGGVAPSPLAADDDAWFPAGGHAERRVVKAKNGLADGDGPGKALASGMGLLRYPFETAASAAVLPADDAAPARTGAAFFRSRAPPAA